ncbi:hypothetical protein KAJ77_06820 [bacterium]|nr:hypothetical protein [bacterium]
MATEEVDRSSKRYTEGCQSEAVSQIVERGHSAAEVESGLGILTSAFA